MAAGASSTVRVLDDRQLAASDLLPPGGQEDDQQQLQLGPPLRDAETAMALLEFDCGPARAAPVVSQPALLLDHMAPLPELPSVDNIYSPAGDPPESVRNTSETE